MPAGRASRTWPARFDGDAIQQALELGRCSEHGRDGTNLKGCLKARRRES